MNEAYEAVIGLEVHVELDTQSKIFCSCQTRFASLPNTQVCPVCMGLPGTLPVLNRRALELAVRAGLALGCKISRLTRFDRKNYFYPDLPKAYQISQNEFPVCLGGEVDIGERKIQITRIHMEEDAGKLVHSGGSTKIDYNRCGIPLIEIVSEPQLHTAAEAKAYLNVLKSRLTYAGVSECKMEEGSMRCDVNLSVRKVGERTLEVRTEMKNISSVTFVGRAIEYEFARQVAVLSEGGKILPETRRFDEHSGKTLSMRTKENAADYRFFPEPDLPTFCIDDRLIDEQRAALPKMPDERVKMYVEEYGLRKTDAEIISSRRQMADFYERVAELTPYRDTAANVLLTELLATVGAYGFDCEMTPDAFSEAVTLFAEKKINSSMLKKLLSLVRDTGKEVSVLVKEHDLFQIRDREYLDAVLIKVLTENPKLLMDYRSGKSSVSRAIIGKAMAVTEGRADPTVLGELLERRKN